MSAIKGNLYRLRQIMRTKFETEEVICCSYKIQEKPLHNFFR